VRISPDAAVLSEQISQPCSGSATGRLVWVGSLNERLSQPAESDEVIVSARVLECERRSDGPH
jgi:hypothetical protein